MPVLLVREYGTALALCVDLGTPRSGSALSLGECYLSMRVTCRCAILLLPP